MLNSNITSSPFIGPPHFVDLHVNPGESVSIQFFDGNETILQGPTTIKMISQYAYPPMPLPVQVPPGHMIQQIVDENGTLRHIVLSALDGTAAINGYCNSALPPPQHQQQQQQQLQSGANNSTYSCCCCYTYCATNGGPSTTLVAPVNGTMQQQQTSLQPSQQSQLSPSRMFPLNHTFGRSRRSARNFSSPNSTKRSNSYGACYFGAANSATASGGKVNSARSNKSDNPKSNQRLSGANLPFDHFTKQYDTNDTKYLTNFSNKNYDYSCNSSNTSQASTFDQINDNPKYYKEEENNCVREDIPKKLFDNNNTNRAKDLYRHQMDHNHQPSSNHYLYQSTNMNSCQNDSQKSSQNDLPDLNQDKKKQSTRKLTNSVINNIQSNNNYSNETKDKKPISTEKVDFLNENDNEAIKKKQKSEPIKHDESSRNVKKPVLIVATSVAVDDMDANEVVSSEPTKNVPTYRGSNEEHLLEIEPKKILSNGISKSMATSNEPTHVITSEESRKEMCDDNHFESPMATKNDDKKKEKIDERKEEEKEEEEEEEEEEKKEEKEKEEGEEGEKIKDEGPNLITTHRSPRHLLPKLEVINLNYHSIAANSIRLKWSFAQSGDGSPDQYKKHFVVDMLQCQEEDNVSSRIVFQGHTMGCRVTHLQPLKEYTFRVRTTTEAAVLVSNTLTVTTTVQQAASGSKTVSRRNKHQLQQQVIQQQQQIFHQQQLLLQQQHLTEERQGNSTHSGSLQNNIDNIDQSDRPWAIFLLTLFTTLALVLAVFFQYLLSAN